MAASCSPARTCPTGIDRADFPALGKSTLAQAIDKSVFPGVQGGPLMHVIAAKAVAFHLAATEDFRTRPGAHHRERRACSPGPSPAAGARLVSGGTDNHLALVDVTPLGVTGREAEALLDDVGITVNKNAIPFDVNPPNIASGIRIGTPATTTRGMGPDEMRSIGDWVVDAIRGREDAAVHAADPRGDPGPGRAVPGARTPARSRLSQGLRGVRLISTFDSVVPLLVAAFVAAALVALVLTPLVRRVAIRLDNIDRPDPRRVNAAPIPRGGGVAVAIAFLLVAIAGIAINSQTHQVPIPLALKPSHLVALLAGGAIATLLGVLDDTFQLRARWQLLGQLVLAGLAVAAGIIVTDLNNPFGPGAHRARRHRSPSASRCCGSSA